MVAGSEDSPPAGRRRMSVRGRAATFGAATVAGHLSQFAWIAFGSRTMSGQTFAAVLAAQATYGFLQIVIDNGPGLYGARLSASRRIDAELRGSILRVRVELGALCALLGVAVGAAGGLPSLQATLPFALALFLFAALNYWEPYGHGDIRPWSTYVVLRAAAPAGLAVLCFGLHEPFPVWLAGLAECSVILTVAGAFRLRTYEAARAALSARRGPWRSVTRIGLPVVIGQLGFACGTVVLNATGAVAAAAVFAVGIRLVTGLNQITGTLATALFPQLAAGGREGDLNVRGVWIASRVLVLLSFGATALLMVAPSLITSVLLTHSARGADAVVIVTLSTSCATGFLVLFTLVMLARSGEAAFLGVYGTATAVVLTGAVAVILSPAPHAAAMASFFCAGQLAGMTVLARRAAAALRSAEAIVRRTARAAVVLAVLGATAAAVPAARPATATATVLCAVIAALAGTTRRPRIALGASAAPRI
jgi:O-antigen/teichoic acid export membrane protein